MSGGLIVTYRDVFTVPGFTARGGFCRPQARAWARARGFDWEHFMRHGIDADELTATGDGFALAVVAWAEQRQKEAGDGR